MREILGRVRWANVLGVLAAVIAIMMWPHLRSSPPQLPPEAETAVQVEQPQAEEAQSLQSATEDAQRNSSQQRDVKVRGRRDKRGRNSRSRSSARNRSRSSSRRKGQRPAAAVARPERPSEARTVIVPAVPTGGGEFRP